MTNPDDISLPIELASFSAELQRNMIFIEWITESEIDNVGFDLYRSEQPIEGYQKINGSLIPGAGNSTETRNYSFIDDRIECDKIYYYQLIDIDSHGSKRLHGPIQMSTESLSLPLDDFLEQNFPNPFNPTTTISYGLQNDKRVKLTVYNIQGNKVRELVNSEQSAGHYDILWDARDDQGIRVSSGVYFYKLETDHLSHTGKMVFSR